MENLLPFIISAILIGILIFAFAADAKRDFIICPNQNCGYRGRGKRIGGRSGCLLIILLCLGIIPGLIYLMFAGSAGLVCPKCGMRVQ